MIQIKSKAGLKKLLDWYEELKKSEYWNKKDVVGIIFYSYNNSSLKKGKEKK